MSRLTLLAVLSIVLVTSACASRFNPLNWFGRDRSEAVTVETAPGGIIDPRPLVSQITELHVDRAPGGVIIYTVGIPPTQGYWEPALLIENNGFPVEGVLGFQLRASGPLSSWPQGTERSRQITAGLYLTDQQLAGVRTISVRGAQNLRTVRR